MKTFAVKAEQFLTDAKGRRTGVVLDLQTYEHLREAEEELADIQAYDALHDCTHTEIAAGQSKTMKTNRDETLEEIWAIRRQIAKEFDGDPKKQVAYYQRKQKQPGVKIYQKTRNSRVNARHRVSEIPYTP